MGDDGLTEQQRKWMASVRSSLQSTTGRTLDEWVAIARTCPETAPKARQRWFKETHGLGQNYAMMVMHELAQQSGADPREPMALRDALWSDPAGRVIFEAIQSAVDLLPEVVTGQRKTYTTWSRRYAFAAARPIRGSTVRLGLALEPGPDERRQPASKEGWSERLKSVVVLASPAEVDDSVRAWLAQAAAAD